MNLGGSGGSGIASGDRSIDRSREGEGWWLVCCLWSRKFCCGDQMRLFVRSCDFLIVEGVEVITARDFGVGGESLWLFCELSSSEVTVLLFLCLLGAF